MMEAVSPEVSLLGFSTAHFAPRCLHVLARIGVADALGQEPASAEALAEATGTDAAVLERLMRMTAAHGVFERSALGWSHTPQSELLRSDHPRSLRAFVRMIGGDIAWQGVGALTHSARTGRTAMESILDGGLWAYFRAHPDQARMFDEAMAGKSHAEIDAILPVIDASGYPVIADIGGGRGHVLAALLETAPQARGVLYDQPHVVEAAPRHDRIEPIGGDFFVGPLPRADAYLLGNVLHDWRDRQAVAILAQVRAAAPDHAEVLVFENLLAEAPRPDAAQVLDIVMLTLGGGQERTEGQYAALFEAAGLRLDRVVPTGHSISVMVARPVLR